MKIQDMMVRDVIQIGPDDTVAEAARRMREKSVGCLVATLGGAVKGIVTDRDLLGCLARNHDPRQCNIKFHMNRPVIVLGPAEDHATAAAVLCSRRIKRLPIAKNGKLLGIVSLSDLAALASAEVKKLRSAQDFFTAVIRAQSSQSDVVEDLRAARPEQTGKSQTFEAEAADDLLDVGGPG